MSYDILSMPGVKQPGFHHLSLPRISARDQYVFVTYINANFRRKYIYTTFLSLNIQLFFIYLNAPSVKHCWIPVAPNHSKHVVFLACRVNMAWAGRLLQQRRRVLDKSPQPWQCGSDGSQEQVNLRPRERERKRGREKERRGGD
jgi:hypothetical protein